MNLKLSGRTLFVAFAIGFVALTRLLPHLPNFTPVAAIALFGGAFLNSRRSALALTFAALFLSDILVNVMLYHDVNIASYFSEPFVWAIYLSFGITVLIGSGLQQKMNPLAIGTASVASSLLFWTITNFACWPGNPLYTQDINGLFQCYVAAIPFLGNVVGDLFYNTFLFGAMFLAIKRIPALIKI